MNKSSIYRDPKKPIETTVISLTDTINKHQKSDSYLTIIERLKKEVPILTVLNVRLMALAIIISMEISNSKSEFDTEQKTIDFFKDDENMKKRIYSVLPRKKFDSAGEKDLYLTKLLPNLFRYVKLIEETHKESEPTYVNINYDNLGEQYSDDDEEEKDNDDDEENVTYNPDV